MNARKLIKPVAAALCSVTGALALGSATAVAAPPETPETKPATAITTTTATLNGVLNPTAKASAPVEYDFLYRQSESECAEGTAAPAEFVKAVGKPKEAVSVKVTGLEPSAKYSFCLLARRTGETVVGTTVTFTTSAAPPAVAAESVSAVKATSATLEAQVNPNNQETKYSFNYSTKATGETLEGPITTVAGESPLPAEFGNHLASVATENVLAQNTTYFYRVVAENAQSESEGSPVKGKVEQFKTATPEPPETKPATEIIGSAANLTGVLNPKAVGETGSYEFLYKQSASECEITEEEREHIEQKRTATVASKGISPEPVESRVTALSPNTRYTFCLLARNGADETAVGLPMTFTTLPTPIIESASSAHETPTSADLNAKINPDGTETKYHFEYDTRAYAEGEAAHGTSLPEANIPAGTSGVPVTQHIAELFEGTTYHWRLTASNVSGTTTTRDQTLVYGTPGAGLPDGREYELVSPMQKNGALIGKLFAAPLPAVSEDGSRVIAPTDQCFHGAPSCTGDRQNEGEPYEFLRTSAGWQTHPLAPPATSFETSSYWTISTNAGTVMFSAPTPPAGQDDFYARQPDGSFSHLGPIGERPSLGYPNLSKFMISTADLSHLVYETKSPAWAFDETKVKALYEYSGHGSAKPLLVGVTGAEGSNSLISKCRTDFNNSPEGELNKADGTLSEDGRTVFFTATGHDEAPECSSPAADQLWARVDGELSDAHSVLISGPTPLACTTTECHKNSTEEPSARDALFAGASTDGSRVFFSDTQQLTDSASQDPVTTDTANQCGLTTSEATGCNLYESECTQPCGSHAEEPNASARHLIDISAPPKGLPISGGPRVQRTLAISSDGSHVYFIAKGVLSETPNAQGHTPQNGAENLYVYERDPAYPQGRLAFIAALSPSEHQAWEDGANVTPDGRFLVFTSHRALTTDDTREEGPAQVYRYDAQSGTLIRISIGENGFNDNGNQGVLGSLIESSGKEFTGDASIVTVLSQLEAPTVPVRKDPTMSHDGAYVFFESPVALTPRALNDVPVGTVPETEPPVQLYAQNVYEYHDGHVSLISDGKDVSGGESVQLYGSDASGANVLFSTVDQLVPEDTDTQLDIYDAHICSAGQPCIAPKPLPPPQCDGEACHGSPQGAPVNLTPGSASFAGPGNLIPPPLPKGKTAVQIRAERLARALKACRTKHNKHSRAVCERHAKKLYGKASRAKKAKRAGNHPRLSR